MKIFLDKIDSDFVTIKGPDAHHILQVLRMSGGDAITLCDGEYDYQGVIIDTTHERLDKRHTQRAQIHAPSAGSITSQASVHDLTNVSASVIHPRDSGNLELKVKIISKTLINTEENIDINVYQCVPKSGKFESIVQKCTELGVARIIPVHSTRCIGKINDDKKITRLQKVAEEAAKQCNRGKIPEICAPITFAHAINAMKDMPHKTIPYELEQNLRFRDILQDNMPSFAFLVGPEGGFEDSEIHLARANDIPTVTLGKRILRTETVAPTLAAIISYHIGGY